jgi:hypothetical protein
LRILLFALTETYESLVPALEEKGHIVKLINQHAGGINIYYGGPKAISWAEEEIKRFKPDIVVSNMAGLTLPPSDDYTYFGNTSESSRLELYKWETRQKAWEYGFELPEVVLECNLNEMQRFPYTTYLKSKYHDMWCQAWKVLPDADLDYQNMIFSEEGASPAYVEKEVDFEVEGYCQYRICNGTYTITSIKGIHGDVSGYKIMGAETDWRNLTCLRDLTPEQEEVYREKCEDWLEYAASLGGNYEGNVSGCITSDLKVYWFEHNGRHSMYSDFVGDADSWLESFTKNTDENFWVFNDHIKGEQQCGE